MKRLFVLLLACIGCRESDNTLTIAVASSVYKPAREIVAAFESKTGIATNIVTGSSGKLFAQINEGAPYHVFIAADTTYPGAVVRNGKASRKPQIYGYGKIVLWSLLDSKYIDLSTARTVAIANPKLAPYGRAAMEYLVKQVEFEQIRSGLVYGENIGQTNQFITSRVADAGVTSLSTVRDPEWEGKGVWEMIDTTSYTPIAQAFVIIKQDEEGQATQFGSFFQNEGKSVLRKYGYTF